MTAVTWRPDMHDLGDDDLRALMAAGTYREAMQARAALVDRHHEPAPEPADLDVLIRF